MNIINLKLVSNGEHIGSTPIRERAVNVAKAHANRNSVDVDVIAIMCRAADNGGEERRNKAEEETAQRGGTAGKRGRNGKKKKGTQLLRGKVLFFKDFAPSKSYIQPKISVFLMQPTRICPKQKVLNPKGFNPFSFGPNA